MPSGIRSKLPMRNVHDQSASDDFCLPRGVSPASGRRCCDHGTSRGQACGDNRVVADIGQRRAADRRVLAFEPVQFFRTLAEG